jgi:hypothetical protein
MLEILAELDPVHVRVDRVVGAAVFNGSEGLRIPRLLVGGTTGEVNVDEGLGHPFLRFVELGLGASLDLQHFGKRKPEPGGKADLQELTAIRLVVVEESRTAFHRWLVAVVNVCVKDAPGTRDLKRRFHVERYTGTEGGHFEPCPVRLFAMDFREEFGEV